MFSYHGVTIEIDEIIKYLRKSRTDDPLMSVEEVLEKHEKILDAWCERNFGAIVPESNTFREIVSGETIQARPEFQTALRLMESPKYKAVLVADCSRLGRPDTETIGRITNLFRYTNTFIITPDTVFDLADEFDRERLKMELERSGWYLDAFKKINKRGREASVQAGWFIGNKTPYGYNKIWVLDGKRERPTLEINEQEAEAVRLIFDLYVNQGMGAQNIAHHLNKLGYKTKTGCLWSQATIKPMLKNEHYIGKVFWNKRKETTIVENGEIKKTRPRAKDYAIFDGKHPAIVDLELFEKAQAICGSHAPVPRRKELVNPLSGILFCQCGKAMVYREHKDPRTGREKCAPRVHCPDQMYCHTKSVIYEEIINKVVGVLNDCIADFEIQIKNDGENTVANHTALITRLETRLEKISSKELSQWEKYTEEGMPKAVFDKLNAKVLEEKETVLTALKEARATVPTVDDFKEKICCFTDAVNSLTNPDVPAKEKNRLLKACIERIDYSRERDNSRYSTLFELDVKLRV